MARRIQTREPNTTILLIVEGETEQIYFSQMKSYERLRAVTIKPKLAKYSAPVHILEGAIKASDEHIYDFIWCVFDRDVLDSPSEQFIKLYKQAKKKHFMFAESFPCFEIWFLLHFALPSSDCRTSEGLIKKLKNHIIDYSKETSWLRRKQLYQFLKQYQEDAISHAKILDNPSATDMDKALKTTVHTLTEQILSFTA